LVSVAVGGYVIVRNWITAQTGTTLTLSANNIPPGGNAMGNAPATGASSFIQGALSCLDIFGEWCYNNTTKELFLFTGSNNPSSYNIQAATVDTLFNLGGANSRTVRSNVTTTDINFQGSNYYGVFANGGTSNVVKNCTIHGTGNGVTYANANAPLIDNNTMTNIGGCAVTFFGTTGGTANISNNTIRRAGWFAGMGNNGFDLYTYNCINIIGNNVNIDYNRLDSVGGYGIANYVNSNIKVRYNYISNFMNILQDGGAIYFWSYSNQTVYTGRQIIGNIITKPRNVNSANFKVVLMIYLDDATSDVDVLNNTCFGSTSGPLNVPAIFGNSNNNLRIRGNTLYNVQYGLFLHKFAAPNAGLNTFRQNVVYADATAAAPANLIYADQTAPGATMQASYRLVFSADTNYYRDQAAGFPHPFWGYGQGASYGYQNAPDMNLAAWKTYINGEANSVALPTTTPDFQFNATKVAVTYSFSGLSKKDAQGNTYNNSAVLQPFTSKIFFPNGTATGTSLAATSTQTAIACNGGNSTVVVSATGGTSPYTGTGTFTVAAGTYTYKVKDAVNDSVTVTVTVTQPPVLAVASSRTNVLCFGGTGTITTLVTGGTLPVTHKWSNGATTANVFPTAGTYTDTVTDARGCKVNTGAIIITQPAAALTAGTPTASAIVSNGGTTTITQPGVTGGTIDYVYQLNGGTAQTSNVFTNVPAGVYVITIKDANNCSITKNITITQPNVFTSSASATTIACNGDSSTVTVTASGGTAPYTGTGTFKRVAGTYVFTVTDNLGNTSAANVTITQPSKLLASATATTISIFGGLSTVVISSTGGTGAVTGTGTFSVPAGIYTYTVTDANTCKSSVIVSLSNPVVVAPQFLQTNITFKNGN
jgi:hypothetical protein